MTSRNLHTQFIYILTIVVALTIATPVFLHAQAGQTGGKPHPICIEWVKQCQKGKCPPPPKCPVSTPIGPSIGHCVSVLCEGDTAPGLSGGQQALDKGLEMLKGLIEKALGGGGGGGGGMPPPMPPGSGMPPQQPNVLDQLKLPETSDQLLDDLNKEKDEGASGILDSVFGIFKKDDDEETTVTKTSSGTSTDDTSGGTSGSSGDSTGGTSGSDAGGSTGSDGTGVVVSGDDATTISGERSEVRSSDNEATLEANVRDDEENSEVGGFYGFTSRAVGQVSVVERLCTSRPWSNSFVSRIIPDTFFDGLCIKRGFDVSEAAKGEGVGIQAPANITEAEDRVKARIEERQKPDVESGEPGILCEPEIARPGDDINLSFSCGAADLEGTSGFTVLEAGETSATVSAVATAQYGISCSNDKIYSCITQVFDPRVSIWADPANVPLGTRTTVFWTTEDVDGCVIKGPSFSETGPFGGASTVPINGESEYTITCVAPDGGEISEDTTVDLSI